MMTYTKHLIGSLDRTLKDHSLRAKLHAPVYGPRTTTLPIQLASSADLKMVEKLADQAALNARVHQVRVTRNAGRMEFQFQLPHSQWKPVTLTEGGRGLRPVLGLGIDSTAIGVDLSKSLYAHAMVIGASGSGKTTLLRVILWQIMQAPASELQVALVDVKRGQLDEFRYMPHVTGYADDVTAAEDLLLQIAGTLSVRTRESMPLVVVIDELAELVRTSRKATRAIGTIARLGRERRVHLLCGTQNVQMPELKREPDIGSNIQLRMCGKVLGPRESFSALNQPGLAAHRVTDSGDFVVAAPNWNGRVIVPQLSGNHLKMLAPPPAENNAPASQVLEEVPEIEQPLYAAEHVAWVLHNSRNGQTPGREAIRVGAKVGGSPRAMELKAYVQNILDEIERLKRGDADAD